MTTQPKILAFSGSTRTGSINTRLLHATVPLCEAAGATVTLVDLKDYPMPLYNGDLEASEGVPEASLRLRDLLTDHHGLLLACPEYNSSITPLLKNTIDWMSRPSEGRSQPYTGRTCGLVACSGGKLGGLRGLIEVRRILGNLGMIVVPTQAAVSGGAGAVGDDGTLTDEAMAKLVKATAEQLVSVTAALN